MRACASWALSLAHVGANIWQPSWDPKQKKDGFFRDKNAPKNGENSNCLQKLEKTNVTFTEKLKLVNFLILY